MFDSPADRLLTYRLAAAYDCWGRRRSLKRGTRNGIWFLDPTGLDAPAGEEAETPVVDRAQTLTGFASSGRFTPIELATLHALVVEQLTIDDIALRDGCSRQAVLARLVGNSKGHGGILKKARALLPSTTLIDEARAGCARDETRAGKPVRGADGGRGRAA